MKINIRMEESKMPSHIEIAQWWADLLDDRFKIAGIGFGLDPIINAVPVLGPIITFGLSVYILWIANAMHASPDIKAKMIRNIVFDAILGAIPVVGTVGDILFKANIRNLKLLKEWHANQPIDGKVIASRKVQTAA